MTLLPKGLSLFVQAEEERKRKEQLFKDKSKFPKVYLKDKETLVGRYLDIEPQPAFIHWFDKEHEFICPDPGGCPLCRLTQSKAVMRGFYPFLVRNFRNEGKDQVCRIDFTATWVNLLAKRHAKYDFTNKDVEITRIGTGKATAYTFDPGEEKALTKEEKKLELPDWGLYLAPATELEINKFLASRKIQPSTHEVEEYEKIDLS